jgi:hypothetical protein
VTFRVIREPSLLGVTHGSLYIDGAWCCWTLEDVMREVKIPGETAIPAGTYTLRLSLSQRFQRLLPELLEVPNFTGIRIHAGNGAGDTSGCLLVGRKRGEQGILESKLALLEVLEYCRRATTAGDPMTITLENPL